MTPDYETPLEAARKAVEAASGLDPVADHETVIDKLCEANTALLDTVSRLISCVEMKAGVEARDAQEA